MIEFSEQNKMGIIKESAYKADFFDEKNRNIVKEEIGVKVHRRYSIESFYSKCIDKSRNGIYNWY